MELLATYGSLSDEDEAPPQGVKREREPDVSDTGTSDDKRQKTSKATDVTHTYSESDSVELPLFFEDKTEQLKDNPAEHQGRKRQFPHLKGNFATIFYLKVMPELIGTSVPLITAVEKRVRTQLFATETKDLHVSLSKTFPIRIHQAELLLTQVRQSLKEANIRQFSLDLGSYGLFFNEDKSRSFLSLHVTHGKLQVCEVIRVLDEVLTQFAFPTFYQPPRPHCSIGWTQTDLSSFEEEVVDYLDTEFELNVTEIWCKIGDQLHRIPLQR